MDDPTTQATVHPVILDTDILIWYFRASAKARRFIEGVPHEQRITSSLVLMELVQGCRRPEEVEEVEAFHRQNIARVVIPDESVCSRAIDLLKRFAASSGLRVVDALIAATALGHRLSLATANTKH
ncbi:MAG: PIN domain-containing protein [Nitrospirota bacterium]